MEEYIPSPRIQGRNHKLLYCFNILYMIGILAAVSGFILIGSAIKRPGSAVMKIESVSASTSNKGTQSDPITARWNVSLSLSNPKEGHGINFRGLEIAIKCNKSVELGKVVVPAGFHQRPGVVSSVNGSVEVLVSQLSACSTASFLPPWIILDFDVGVRVEYDSWVGKYETSVDVCKGMWVGFKSNASAQGTILRGVEESCWILNIG